MLINISFEEYEKTPERYTLVDVRSPSEYAESTITHAVNVPLFSDEARAHVGTVYKQEGKAVAVRTGLKYVSETLMEMYEKLESLTSPKKKLLIFCARGGMRSESVGSFIASLGLPAARLIKGYKGYRNHIVTHLPSMISEIETVTVYGKTGSGKTHILHEISKLGYDTLDLEACAGHRGSLLGELGLPPQNSQKQFETCLYDSLKNASSKVIFTEGESKRIGNVYLPGILYDKMKTGRKILVECDIQMRKEIIKKDYLEGSFDKERACEALSRLIRYIGKERAETYIRLIHEEAYDEVIEELMLRYYDIVYNTLHETYEKTFVNTGAEKCADEIVKYIEEV